MASTTLTSLAAGSAKASPPCCCARHPRSPRVTAAMLQCCASSAKPFSALPPLATPPVNSVASSCSHRGIHQVVLLCPSELAQPHMCQRQGQAVVQTC